MTKKRRWMRQAGTWANLSIVGIQFPVAIAIGFFWGKWLDGHLGTWPWLTAAFSFFGIIAGFVNLFRITAQAELMERRDAERRDREAGDADGVEESGEDAGC